MTVSSSVAKSGPYSANGVTTTFARSFLALDEDHVRVFSTDADGTVSEITTGFTQTGIGGASGNVVFAVAPADGLTITLLRAVPQTQESDYASQGSVSPEQIERDLDLLAMQVQDFGEKLDRVPRLPVSTTLDEPAFPEPETGKLLTARADGAGWENGLAISDLATKADIPPEIINWVPEGGVLLLSQIADDAAMQSDARGNILTLLAEAEARGWEARITAPADQDFAALGYEADFIAHTLTRDMRFSMEDGALIYSKLCYQHFACNGTQKTFDITAWPYEGEQIGVMTVVGATPTKLVPDTDFTMSEVTPGAWRITCAVAPPAGATLVATSGRSALTFRTDDPTGDITLRGHGGRFDVSRAGWAESSAGRSGLALINVPHVRWTGLIHTFGRMESAWTADPLARRGDAGVSILAHKTASFEHIRGDYLNDLVIYVTGGASTGTSDDGMWTRVGFLEGRRTKTGFKNVREHSALMIGEVALVEGSTGLIHGDTDGLVSEGSVQVGLMRLERMARRGLHVNNSIAPISVQSLVMRDLGRHPDTLAVTDDCCAIYGTNCRGLTVGHLGVTWKDWTPPAERPAVWFTGAGNYGNRILGGFVESMDIGVLETGSMTNSTGSSVALTLKDVPTPVSLPPGSDLEYDITRLTESAGTITTTHWRRRGIRRVYDPALYFSGATPGALTHAAREGTYVVDDYRRCTVSLHVQVTATHSGGGDELRITLPIAADTSESEVQVLPVAHFNGINVPGDDASLVAEIVDGGEYARLRYWYDDGTPDGATGTIATAHVTSGASVRVYIGGTYFAAFAGA